MTDDLETGSEEITPKEREWSRYYKWRQVFGDPGLKKDYNNSKAAGVETPKPGGEGRISRVFDRLKPKRDEDLTKLIEKDEELEEYASTSRYFRVTSEGNDARFQRVYIDYNDKVYLQDLQTKQTFLVGVGSQDLKGIVRDYKREQTNLGNSVKEVRKLKPQPVEIPQGEIRDGWQEAKDAVDEKFGTEELTYEKLFEGGGFKDNRGEPLSVEQSSQRNREIARLQEILSSFDEGDANLLNLAEKLFEDSNDLKLGISFLINNEGVPVDIKNQIENQVSIALRDLSAVNTLINTDLEIDGLPIDGDTLRLIQEFVSAQRHLVHLAGETIMSGGDRKGELKNELTNLLKRHEHLLMELNASDDPQLRADLSEHIVKEEGDRKGENDTGSEDVDVAATGVPEVVSVESGNNGNPDEQSNMAQVKVDNPTDNDPDVEQESKELKITKLTTEQSAALEKIRDLDLDKLPTTMQELVDINTLMETVIPGSLEANDDNYKAYKRFGNRIKEAIKEINVDMLTTTTRYRLQRLQSILENSGQWRDTTTSTTEVNDDPLTQSPASSLPDGEAILFEDGTDIGEEPSVGVQEPEAIPIDDWATEEPKVVEEKSEQTRPEPTDNETGKRKSRPDSIPQPQELVISPQINEEIVQVLQKYQYEGEVVKSLGGGFEGKTYLVRVTKYLGDEVSSDNHIVIKYISEKAEKISNPNRVIPASVRYAETRGVIPNNDGEQYSMNFLGRSGRVQLLEYIEGEHVFESDLNLLKKYNAVLQFAHFHQLLRESDMFNLDIKGENYILESNGKMRVIDISNTFLRLNESTKSEFTAARINMTESRLLLSLLDRSLNSDSDSSTGILLKLAGVAGGNYETKSKAVKYRIGQIVNSDEFKNLPVSVQRIALYELGLYKDENLRLGPEENKYSKRFEMVMALAKDSGLETSHLAESLANAVEDAGMQIFDEFENAELVDFPDTPELSEVEKKLKTTDIDTLQGMSYLGYVKPVIWARLVMGRGAGFYNPDSVSQGAFVEKLRTAVNDYNQKYEQVRDENIGIIPEEEWERLLDNDQLLVESMIRDEIDSVEIDIEEGSPVEQIRAAVVKATLVALLDIRREFLDKILRGELGVDTFDKLEEFYKTYYRRVQNISDYEQFKQELVAKKRETIDKIYNMDSLMKSEE